MAAEKKDPLGRRAKALNAGLHEACVTEIIPVSECYCIPYLDWILDLVRLSHTRNKGNPDKGPTAPRGWIAIQTTSKEAVFYSNQKRGGYYWAFGFPLVSNCWGIPKLSHCIALMAVFHYWRWSEKEAHQLGDIPAAICVPLSEFDSLTCDQRARKRLVSEINSIFSTMKIYKSVKPFSGMASGRPFTLLKPTRSTRKGVVTFELSDAFMRSLDDEWRAAKRYGARKIAFIPRTLSAIDPHKRKSILCGFILAVRYSMNSATRNRISLQKLKEQLLYGEDRNWLTPGDSSTHKGASLHEILSDLEMAGLLAGYSFTADSGADLPDPRRIKNGNLVYSIPAIDSEKQKYKKTSPQKKNTLPGN